MSSCVSCERCDKPASACYRDGPPGHSEHVCACPDHTNQYESSHRSGIDVRYLEDEKYYDEET